MQFNSIKVDLVVFRRQLVLVAVDEVPLSVQIKTTTCKCRTAYGRKMSGEWK